MAYVFISAFSKVISTIVAPDKISIDNWCFKLFYRITPMILGVSTVLCSLKWVELWWKLSQLLNDSVQQKCIYWLQPWPWPSSSSKCFWHVKYLLSKIIIDVLKVWKSFFSKQTYLFTWASFNQGFHQYNTIPHSTRSTPLNFLSTMCSLFAININIKIYFQSTVWRTYNLWCWICKSRLFSILFKLFNLRPKTV